MNLHEYLHSWRNIVTFNLVLWTENIEKQGHVLHFYQNSIQLSFLSQQGGSILITVGPLEGNNLARK